MIKDYWKNKEQRAILAKKHTEEMSASYKKEIEASVNDSIIYSGDSSLPLMPKPHQSTIYVDDIDTITAIFKYSNGRTAALNFASYKNPGGMFLNGSKAQEESICHESFLYNVLSQLPEYYAWNHQNKNRCLYTNRAVYTPNVAICRENTPVKYCDIITCAAPNKTAAQKYCNVSDYENHVALEERIKFVLDIADKGDIDTLILGAFGCGVFGQDPYEVADLFSSYIEYYDFKNIIFAIPDSTSDNYKAFYKKFNK